jgi:lantibiotic modifying enzyme
MSLTTAEFRKVESRSESARLVSGRELRRMLKALAVSQSGARRASPLAKLCAAGVDYGWRELERMAGRNLLDMTSTRARASLRRHLQKNLERITRPCFELEWTSFKLAMNALGLAASDATLTKRMFFRDQPGDRLSLLFQKFPVLASLWCLAIGRWREHVVEVLDRVTKDGRTLSRFFFSNPFNGAITNVRLGLSDEHYGGRSVTFIEFSGGRRVIYKPRSGTSESAWFSFLEWMNRNGLQPKLRIAHVLLRKDYYWMEHMEAASCKNETAVRRFYERMGGLIAAAYLLKAVDCHRENVIAAGEYPVLVDVDALWQVSPLTKTQSSADVLYRTGFFPSSKPGSLQSRSSVLGKASSGTHLARLAGKPVAAACYANELITGFSRAWGCVLGTPTRRAAFLRNVRRLRAQKRRWIYRSTNTYAAILRASLEPSALRSTATREALLRRLCLLSAGSKTVVQAEISSLRHLDIPYFSRRTKGWMPPEKDPLPLELTQAIRNALRWTEK